MPEIRTYLQPVLHGAFHGFPVTRTVDDFDPYQRWMIERMVVMAKVLIAAFMGSGKTAAALRAFWEIRQHDPTCRALVVAPYEVARNTWPDEIMQWDFARSLTYSVAMGDVARRVQAVANKVDLTFINRENYGWLVQHMDKHHPGEWPWKILIYDEASRLKSGREHTDLGNLTEFGWLRQTEHRFQRIWELSGTPSSNGWMDLWGPIYLLDRGERLGRTLAAFRKRWFRHDGYTNKYEPHDFAEQDFRERLGDIMFCLREEDYINLPPLVLRDRFVPLSASDMKAYRAFERTLIFEEFDIEAANSAVLVNKLLQFANGSVYAQQDEMDEGPPIAMKVHDAKLHELDSILHETGGKPVLIMYSYKFDLWEITKKFPFVRVFGKTNTDLEDWNAGRIRAMAMHPASAGHGLNFQHGGHIAVWYGLNWSLELYQQAMKRLHRRGQEADRVFVYRILARDTMDEEVAWRLEDKGATQDRILDAFRVRVEQVMRMAA